LEETVKRLILVAATLAMAAAIPCAQAADIVIDDPRWGKLSAEQQNDIVQRLKAAKAIGADDRVVYKAPKTNVISEKNFNPIAAGPALAAGICRIKNLFSRSECAKIADSAQRKACQDAEKARYDKVKSACR
jgi:hypothetical protein